MTAMAALLITGAGRAAELRLKPETVRAWEQYIAEKNAEAKSFPDPAPFAAHGGRDLWTALRDGKIVVVPAGPNIPRRVPSGLIHDWIGTAFIPNATIPQVLAVVRDYNDYKNFYRPGTVDSKVCMATGYEDKFSLVLANKSFSTKKALEGDYRATYFRVNKNRWYSLAESTRIQEIEGYGESDARRLPEGEGSGLIWRAANVIRYEERDGGVIVQFEAMALSRDIPGALRWIIDPMVRRVSRETVHLYLQKTRDAVRSAPAELRSTAAAVAGP